MTTTSPPAWLTSSAPSTNSTSLIWPTPPPRHGCQDGCSQIFRLYVFGPSGLKYYGSATLCCKIWSLPDCTRVEGVGPQYGIKFCHLATLCQGRGPQHPVRRLVHGRGRVVNANHLQRAHSPQGVLRQLGTLDLQARYTSTDQGFWITTFCIFLLNGHIMQLRRHDCLCLYPTWFTLGHVMLSLVAHWTAESQVILWGKSSFVKRSIDKIVMSNERWNTHSHLSLIQVSSVDWFGSIC